MLFLTLAASLSLINAAPGTPAAASFLSTTPIVVADNDTRRNSQPSTTVRTTTRAQAVQRAPAVTRAQPVFVRQQRVFERQQPAVVREQPVRFQQTPVRSVDMMRARINAAQEAQFRQTEVMRARINAAQEAQAHQAAIIRAQENAARIEAHATAVERARINAAQEAQLHQTAVIRARINAAEQARFRETNMLRRSEVVRARARASALNEPLPSHSFVTRERFAPAFLRERSGAITRANVFERGDELVRDAAFARSNPFERGNIFVTNRFAAIEEASEPAVIRERIGTDCVTRAFVVPTTTVLQPTVVDILPPSPFVTQEAFVTEPAFETVAEFGNEDFQNTMFTNEFFAPVGFVEPTTFVTPVGFFEPAPMTLAPVAFVSPAFVAPSNVAISGNIVDVGPGSVDLATAAGIVTALLGSSTFIEGETGLVSDGLGLVPGENVTVFGVDNNGFVDASTVRINGGVGALNDVMLNGVVSLANPGLGGFVLTQEAQPTMVMLTPQTVIEENAVPVGITAIAPAEPVTVLGTVSNGVFVADRVMIAG